MSPTGGAQSVGGKWRSQVQLGDEGVKKHPLTLTLSPGDGPVG